MARITTTDQVLRLLQERLEKAQRRKPQLEARSTTPRERVEAMASVRTLDQRSFRKALVRGLLAQDLGETLVGDPAFDRVIQGVLSILEDSPAGLELLSQSEGLLGRSER